MQRASQIRQLVNFVSKRNKASATNIPTPTFDQLRIHYISNGLPMVGFGFMDETGEYGLHISPLQSN